MSVNKEKPFIPIDDRFKIVRGHGTSVNLIESVTFFSKKNNSNEVREEVRGYFPTVAQALQKYVAIISREKDYGSLVDYYNEIKRLTNDVIGIEDLFKELDKKERSGGE